MSSQFAAVGTDGTRPVVWGLGETEEAALADGFYELAKNCEPHEANVDLRAVAVDAERATRIRAGDVDASDL